ncbi:MAG: hypothetical protein AB7K08_03615 [Microbacteriaceae bacterium]
MLRRLIDGALGLADEGSRAAQSSRGSVGLDQPAAAVAAVEERSVLVANVRRRNLLQHLL